MMGPLAENFAEVHDRDPRDSVLLAGDATRVTVTSYVNFWFASGKLRVLGLIVRLRPAGGLTLKL